MADRNQKTEKPCRACSDFKSWTKRMTGAKKSNDQQENRNLNAAKEDKRIECPVDKDVLGHSTWNFLHTMAAYYPNEPTNKQQHEMKQFIKLFSKFYPCDHCAIHLQQRLKTESPDTSNNTALSKWFCDVHNEVNLRLGKNTFDCSKVMDRWKDGWPDGSCD